MQVSEAYERLLAIPVSRIDWKDGSRPLILGRAVRVRHNEDDHDGDKHLEVWIETSPEGLWIGFNARSQPGDPQMHGQTEPLSNIARII
jgi:hypothetical protein